MYQYIAIAAYIVVLFLTLRDIRIFRRTRFASYRKGALKGILASSVILIGTLIVGMNPEIGLVIVFIGLISIERGCVKKYLSAHQLLRGLWERQTFEILSL